MPGGNMSRGKCYTPGDRAFTVAAVRVWNSLPSTLVFQSCLKIIFSTHIPTPALINIHSVRAVTFVVAWNIHFSVTYFLKSTIVIVTELTEKLEQLSEINDKLD